MPKPTKTIRIDVEVWKILQSRVTEPLLDTPNRVLRRLFGLDNASR